MKGSRLGRGSSFGILGLLLVLIVIAMIIVMVVLVIILGRNHHRSFGRHLGQMREPGRAVRADSCVQSVGWM